MRAMRSMSATTCRRSSGMITIDPGAATESRNMKLASLKDGSRDGRLVVVSTDLSRCVAAADIAPTLPAALDRWDETEPALRVLAGQLNAGRCGDEAEDFHAIACHSPLPRAY